jgi:UDP-N-acetylmuramoylalanine--D-glutamate ligase
MKIAIAGYGLEGEENYNYWNTLGNELTVVDERAEPTHELPKDIGATLLGPGSLEKLDGFDLVIRTAGLAPYKIKTDGKIWSATNEFFAKCPAKIIGVTGTKGKGTTSSLIAAIFEAAGKKTWLVGNIGISALNVLKDIQPDDVVVFEMSSFQLWDIERSPHTAVVLLIEADHLNVHQGMEDYVQAKANIRRFQGDDDVCVYHPTNHNSRIVAESSNRGKTLRYGISDDGGVYVQDGNFYITEQIICSVAALQLIGQHNIENACAALSVAKLWGIDNESIEKGLRAFKGLPHRLELIRNYNGVDYYNDSFSSAPAATVAAIKSFTQPEIVILGGIDKGGDFSELMTTIHDKANIKEIIIIGEIKNKLATALREAGVGTKVTISDADTMTEIVNYATSVAIEGDVVLLSPGCASFDMFKDFYDRGEQFRAVVLAL